MTRQITHCQPVAPDRLTQFLDRKLELPDVILLMQDLIDTGLLAFLPEPVFDCAYYCVHQKFCQVPGRALQ